MMSCHLYKSPVAPGGASKHPNELKHFHLLDEVDVDMKGFLKSPTPLTRAARYPKHQSHIHSLRDDALAATSPKERFTLLDRQILQPDRAETCQSGTDDEVARHQSPYDPIETTVDNEVSALREEYRREGDLHDPLLVSPANPSVSHILQLEEERAVPGMHPLGSVKGWTSKRKKALLRTEPYVFRAYEAVFPGYRLDKKVSRMSIRP